jgi:hypothetical protein
MVLGAQPAATTAPKTMSAAGNYANISWDLGTELARGTPFAGARLQISVRTFTSSTGVPGYQLQNPILVAGGSALHIAGLSLIVNGALVAGATTYQSLDRYVPANGQRTLSSTTLTFEATVNAADTLAIAVGTLAATRFNPVTLTQLNAAGGVFAQNCLNCHNANNRQGGTDLTNRADLINRLLVVPFVPQASYVLTRMNDSAAPMPPGGLISAGSRQIVSDWILDGAP